jgi:hypothetical protein
MKLKQLIVVALLLLSGGVSMQAQQMQMPKIPVDTAVRIGKLSNGLTYYIRHNNYPEHQRKLLHCSASRFNSGERRPARSRSFP